MESNNYLNFIPGVNPSKEKSSTDLWFIFHNNKLLVKNHEGNLSIPKMNDIVNLDIELGTEHFLGELNGESCYTAACLNTLDLPSHMEFQDLRTAGAMISEEIFLLSGRASQILFWDSTHQYCSRCGNKTAALLGERAKECPKCGFISYPKICPATITAIVKDDKILLAHNANFPKGLYSLIAGFVEPGETFEECVKREILEEVGVKVKNVKYFSSQPWPFPNSLMIAFTAEYDSGEIQVDGIEITDAGWFSVDNLPIIPSKVSVASKVLKWFIESHSK